MLLILYLCSSRLSRVGQGVWGVLQFSSSFFGKSETTFLLTIQNPNLFDKNRPLTLGAPNSPPLHQTNFPDHLHLLHSTLILNAFPSIKRIFVLAQKVSKMNFFKIFPAFSALSVFLYCILHIYPIKCTNFTI